MKTARPISRKFPVLIVLAFLFSCGTINAQENKKETQTNSAAANDSVVLLVKGKIKSGDNTVYRSTIDVRDTSGNIIASAYSYKGEFTIKVPVAYPKQAFTIEVTSKGYKKEYIEDYVWSYGSVVEVEMKRSLIGTPSRAFRTVICPNF